MYIYTIYIIRSDENSMINIEEEESIQTDLHGIALSEIQAVVST